MISFCDQAEGFEAGIALLKQSGDKKKIVDSDEDAGSEDDSVRLRILISLVPPDSHVDSKNSD